MRDEHVGSLVIVDESNGKRVPVGMLTDRDVVIRVFATNDKHIDMLSVGDVMTTEIITASNSDTLDETLKRMRSFGVRRIPIVNSEGGLEGLIAFDDLIEYLAEEVNDLAALLSREQHREKERRY
jgi:CBS domain-containing protein